MSKIILIAAIIVLAYTTVVPRVGPIESHPPLIYKVQIKDPPKVRWAPIINDFK